MKPLRTKFARRRFQVERDENGVPHIRSDSWRTCLYALGYVHAIDRPTQILFAREIARGTASARISNTHELAEADRFFRKAGLYRRLEEEARSLDDRTFGDLTSYCEGINDGMKDAGRSLPMWATGFEPEPWTQKSVLLIGNLLSYGGLAIGQQQSERLLLELIQLVKDDERLRELFAPRLDNVDFDLLRRVKISHQLSDQALELIADLPRLAGSNAWAVAPNVRPAVPPCWPRTRTWKSIACRPSGTRRFWHGKTTTSWEPRCPVVRCLASDAMIACPGE